MCIIGAYQYVFVPNIHIKEWVDAAQFPKLMRRMSSTLQNPNLLGAYLLMVLSVCISYILVYMKENRNPRSGYDAHYRYYIILNNAINLF